MKIPHLSIVSFGIFFRSKYFLSGVLLLYAALCCLIYFHFHNNFISEEVAPFLTVSPRIVSGFAEDDKPRYAIFDKDIPDKYSSASIRQIGNLKTAVCNSNFVSYLWQFPSLRLPIMKNGGSGNLSFYVHGLLFRDMYNLDFLRVHAYLVGLLILVATWLLSRHVFGLDEANLSVLLLATSLPFLSNINNLRFCDNYIMLAQIGILLLAYKYRQKEGSLPALFFLFFIIGVSLYIKLTVIFMLSAWVLILLIMKIPVRLKSVPLLFAGLFLVLGALPVILYNIDGSGGGVLFLVNRFLDGASTDASLIKVLPEIIAKIPKNLGFMTSFALGAYSSEPFIMLFTALIFIFFYKDMRIKDHSFKKIKFFLFLPAAMLALITLISYPGNESYYINLLPFLFIASAAVLCRLSYNYPIPAVRRIIYTVVFSCVIVNAAIVTVGVARPYLFSFPGDMDQELVRYLRERNIREPVTFEYAFIGSTEYLSRGEIRPIHYTQVFYSADGARKREILEKIIKDDLHDHYIFSAQRYSHNELSLAEFLDFCRASSIQVKIENIISGGINTYFIVKKG